MNNRYCGPAMREGMRAIPEPKTIVSPGSLEGGYLA